MNRKIGACFELCSLIFLSAYPAAAADPAGSFVIQDGEVRHLLVIDQEKKVLAHVVTEEDPQTMPQVIAAFPQGDSGALLTFHPQGAAAVVAESAHAWSDGAQRGVFIELKSDAKELALDTSGGLGGTWLDSIRQIRDIVSGVPDRGTYLDFADAARVFGGVTVPDGGVSCELVSSDTLKISRTSLLGHTYLAELRVENGSFQSTGSPWRILSSAPLRMSLRVSNDYEPLEPLLEQDIWEPGFEAVGRDALAARFLGTTDKFMAGSYRFLTYFGRDTLITFCNLQDMLRPKAQEVMIGATLDRLSDEGRVAHEEELGDRPIYNHMQQFLQFVRNYQIREAKALIANRKDWGKTTYYYGMVDSDFLLPIAAYKMMKGHNASTEEQKSFWLRTNKRGETNVRSLLRNWNLVLETARRGYVHLPPGVMFGDWRDSNDGLAGGVYAGDINGIFVPAALRSLDRSRPILTELLGLAEVSKAADGFPNVRRLFSNKATSDAEMAPLLAQWDEKRKAFYVTAKGQDLVAEAVRRSRERDPGLLQREVLPGKSLQYLADHTGDFPDLRYLALSADENLHPIAIMNTDEVFSLHFEDLSDKEFASNLLPIFLPYPLGLWTDVGPVVANPAHGADEVWAVRLGTSAYHGQVVWGWVNKALKATLLRQAEKDLGKPEIAGLFLDLYRQVQAADDRSGPLQNTELWGAEVRNGQWTPVSFFDKSDKETLPNPLQLWSITGRMDLIAQRIESRLGKRPKRSSAQLIQQLMALTK